MNQVEVMDLTVVCTGFPEMPEAEIHRENLLDTLDTIFGGDTHLIVIEGLEGVGKTILLSQYAKRHRHHVFSLFIKPGSRLAYAPEYLKLVLAEQLHWALHRELLNDETVDDALLRTQLIALQKRAHRTREKYYFIIDGLCEIPPEDSDVQDIILKDILPLGLSNFCFLLSGDLQNLSSAFHRSIHAKSFFVAPFSLDETSKYLTDLNLSRESTEDLYKMCRGLPGNLTIVRRMLQAGIDVQTLVKEEPAQLPDFLAIEWREVKKAIGDDQVLLAVLAYARTDCTIDELARISGRDTLSVESYLKRVGIIKVETQSGNVSFVSEAHRRYAASQLKSLKEEASQLLITYLVQNKDSEAALSHLPTYYEQAGQLNELLGYLTPQYFDRLIDHSQSLAPLYHKADLGLQTADILRRNEALVRFGIQKSVLSELTRSVVWRSEIEARMQLKDFTAAIALAQSTILKEDRLHLLATINRIRRQSGLLPEPELTEQIRLLYDQIDPVALGDRSIEIACDLVYTDPDLAIRLVEEATKTREGKDALDWAFATLSISAATSPGDSESTQAAEKLRSRITNPNLQGFLSAVSLLFANSSATEVIRQVSKLDPKNRLFFLRRWAVANESKNDTAEVLEHAIDLLIRDTEYTPKTRDLREIATPLPYIADNNKIKALVGRFDSQKGLIEELGTSEDFVRLQLILARAESKYDFTAASNRIMEVYWYISEIQDLETKVECTAWLAASLPDIDTKNELENREGLKTVVEQELRSNVSELLAGTADQLDVFRGVINALAKARPHLALEIAQSLNTLERRDGGTLQLIKGLNNPKELDPEFIQKIVGSITDKKMKDTAIVHVMERLASPGKIVNVKTFLPLIADIMHVAGAHARCRAYCFAYSFLTGQAVDNYSGLKAELLKRLSDSWRSIDAAWKKVDVGFRIARTLADISPDIANTYLKDVTHVRDEIVGDAEGPALTYLACLRLAVRAYGGLLSKNVSSGSYLDWLTKLIDRLPSNGDRAELWATLASRCYINTHIGEAQRIVTEHLKPLIQNISDGDSNYKAEVITRTAAALYIGHRTTALELISKLDSSFRDYAYFHVCLFIMSKVPTGEPYEYTSGDGYSLSSEEAVDVCELMGWIDEDALLYMLIYRIADSVVSRRNREKWSRQQKEDIGNRLESLIAKKLPDKRNITHDGFVIAARAAIARIRQVLSSQVDQLVAAARAIPNIADRAYVMMIIASGMPAKDNAKRTTVFNESRQYVDKILSTVDRVRRYVNLAESTIDIDPTYAKDCLRTAMTSSAKTDDPEIIYQTQRRIIDVAHKLDPNYAASLASLLDSDPARRKTRDDLKQRLATLDLRKEMGVRKLSDVSERVKPSDYPKAAWMNLAGLNAGKLVETVHSEYVAPFILTASTLPLQESYPIFAWIIENAIRRYSRSEHVGSSLVPMFEATLFGAELAGRIAVRSSLHSRHLTRFIDKDFNVGKETIIHAGERDKAIQFVKDWFSKEGGEYIKICDPYFGRSDLELLHILQGINPQCRFSVLTSRKHQLQDGVQQPLDESYRTHWRIRVSNTEPPYTDIVVAGVESSGDLPIHDRWWVTPRGGICLGTSFNSLGVGKSASIRIIGAEEARMFEDEIDQYLSRVKREHNREKLLHNLFGL